MNRNTLILGSLVTAIFSVQTAFAEDPGSTGFSFLKVSRGARHAGMGDVGVAISPDLYGVYFNPAVASGAGNTAIGFVHQEQIFDSRKEFVGGVTPALGGAVCFGLDYFQIPDIERRDAATELPVGYFDAQDILVYAGLARPLAAGVSAGICVKYAAERIESQTADAILLDLGGLYELNQFLSFGLAIRNIGGKPAFISEEIELPAILTGGAAVRHDRLRAAIDVVRIKETDTRINLGVEGKFTEILALRGGYKFGYDNENVSFGLGLSHSIWTVDYAFVPMQAGLGSNHRLALTARVI
jgi:hypothetical protein